MSAKFPHAYPKITVTWADHHATPINEEITPDSIHDWMEPSIRETTGYLVCETKRTLAVAGTIEENGSFCDVTVLMKRAVLNLEKL